MKRIFSIFILILSLFFIDDVCAETSINNVNNNQNTFDAFPQFFDLRRLGLVSPIKNQKSYGTCWSFASLGAIETSLIPKNPNIDFSEWHLAYFNYYGDNTVDLAPFEEFYNSGGYPSFYTSTLSQWIGPVLENELPYETPKEEIDLSLKQKSEYHLQKSYLLNGYANYRLSPSEEILNFTINEIKSLLISKNAVVANYFHSDENYNNENFSYYIKTKQNPNHAILIVGWDDNFKKENFKFQPQNNGAWLIKNSWGDKWGENGYFWISYEDASLTDTNVLFVENNDNYDNIYLHDNMGFNTSISADNINRKSSYMANVFTAENNEDLSAVSFYTTDRKASYEIYIYTNLKNQSNPTSGFLAHKQSGYEDFAGYHTINLDKKVKIEKNSKFSIVVKLTNPTNLYPIAIEACVILGERTQNIDLGRMSKNKINSNTNYYESFISSNGLNWTDTKNLKIMRTSEEKEYFDQDISIYTGNVSIKAFTNSIDKIEFSNKNEYVSKNELINLSCENSKEIYFTLDGTEPNLNSLKFKDSILISKDTLIKASAFINGELKSVNSKHYKLLQSKLSSLTINKENIDLHDLNEKNELYFHLKTLEDSITLFPIGTGKITLNNEILLNSGVTSEPIKLKTGYNKFTISISEEGKLDTVYNLTVFRDYAIVNYYDETIYFDSDTVVTDINNNKLISNQSITPYLGQKLFITPFEHEEYEINLSDREKLTDLSYYINYNNETISNIFSISSRIVFSDNFEMLNSNPAEIRKMNILDDLYFKLNLKNDKELYFQIPANEKEPASDILHISLPSKAELQDEYFNIDQISESSITFTLKDAVTNNSSYEIELFNNNNSADFDNILSFKNRFLSDTITIDNLLPATYYIIKVKYGATSNSFATYPKYIKIRTLGESNYFYIDYQKEIITIDDSLCEIFTNENNKINSYDSISSLTGEKITIFPLDKSKDPFVFEIPSRPLPPDITVDFLNSCLLNELPEGTMFSRYNFLDDYAKIDYFLNNRKLYFFDLYIHGFNSNDIIYLKVNATESSFSSNVVKLIIPTLKKTPRDSLEILNYGSNYIILKENNLLEYSIKTGRGSNYIWQESNIFENLLPNTEYKIATRFKSTNDNISSLPTMNRIITLSNDYVNGDLNSDSQITYIDYVFLKQYLLKEVDLDNFQIRTADLNKDSKINIFDLSRILYNINYN